MPEQSVNAKTGKRRRVRFAADSTPLPKGIYSRLSSTRLPEPENTEDTKWQSTPTNASQASLLHDQSLDYAVTSFDLNQELREGKLVGEDGIVPTELASDDGSSSSGDVEIPRKKRRQESDNDDDDGESDVLSLPDAIAAVVSVLRPEETSAGMKTPAALVLASFNLANRTREDLLSLVPKWSLRWGAPGGRTHGPFNTSEMLTWARARYFCQPSRVGHVRPVEGCKWAPASAIFTPSDHNA